MGIIDGYGRLKDDPRVSAQVGARRAGTPVQGRRRVRGLCRQAAVSSRHPPLGSRAARPMAVLARTCTQHQAIVAPHRSPAPPAPLQTPKTPLFKWNTKLVKKLPWLHMDPNQPPQLSVLSDRSAIFEGALRVGHGWVGRRVPMQPSNTQGEGSGAVLLLS